MTLSYLELKNFRLHKHTQLEFSKELNYIVGGNGQGKTTLLEAIYFLCTTKSLVSSVDSEAVNFNSQFFEIEGKFVDRVENKIKVIYDTAKNKKFIFLDNKQIHRYTSLIGKFPVVTLVQPDHQITMGPPSARRKFIDSVISQASETYLKLLVEYNKILKHRSAILNRIKETGRNDFDLDTWNQRLISVGTNIINHRKNFIKEFEVYVVEAYKKIMKEAEIPSIEYYYLDSVNGEIENRFSKLLEQKREIEIIRAANLVGPHRDDYKFGINGFDLRKYGSQGQHKTFQIAIKFAQFFYLKDKLGKAPIFLMDDVFGELDSNRASKIGGYLREIGQAFITVTDLSNIEMLNIKETDRTIKITGGVAAYA